MEHNYFIRYWTAEVDGRTVKMHSEVSPCCYMYPNYPLQLSIVMENGGNIIIGAKDTGRAIPMNCVTEADIDFVLSFIKLVPCKTPGCQGVAFAQYTNRDGWCEQCFLEDLNKSFKKSLEEYETELANQDAKMKAEGWTHRVTAWIHPTRGGDDREADWYFKGEPTVRQIKSLITKAGSCRNDDYNIIKL